MLVKFVTTPRNMQLHLVRHGQTCWNAEARIQGQLDSTLDELREICLGAWQGRLWDDVQQEAPEQVEHLRAVTPGFDVDGAESYVDIQRRGVAAIANKPVQNTPWIRAVA